LLIGVVGYRVEGIDASGLLKKISGSSELAAEIEGDSAHRQHCC